MNHNEYLSLSRSRAQAAKQLAMQALEGQLPDGYVLSDDADQMFSNALFRVKPKQTHEGDHSIHCLHSLHYSSIRIVDGEHLVQTTEETIRFIGDIHNGSTWERDAEWGIDGCIQSKVYSQPDLADAVREAVSMTLTQRPFTISSNGCATITMLTKTSATTARL